MKSLYTVQCKYNAADNQNPKERFDDSLPKVTLKVKAKLN
jgi:hypothetical protein